MRPGSGRGRGPLRGHAEGQDPKGPCKRDFDLDLDEDEGLCFLSAGELLAAGAASMIGLAAASILPGAPVEAPQALDDPERA
eukprot:7789891-Pyramimonas_sp.AAC.1